MEYYSSKGLQHSSPSWQPETESQSITAGATRLIEWLETHELALYLEPGTPTRGDNVLDLVFSNLPVRATVEDYLSTSSDHATILITVDWEEAPPHPKLGSTNWEKARAILTPPLPSLPINTLAEELVSRAQLTIRGTSEYNTRRLPRTPWWTPELTTLLQQTKQQHTPDYLPLWKAISRAKANY
jgi:hypothetical protein